ncbi:MAG: hypothetical protein EBT13_07680 [Rhodobacteraceae bacterium]|nr:hypothetical protein [Paracoccaceae bacterium]
MPLLPKGFLMRRSRKLGEGPIMRQQFGATMDSKAIVSKLQLDPLREDFKNNSTQNVMSEAMRWNWSYWR